jgi:site-specific DNA-methyltransferase (adenine-specific)/modification methylase
MKPERLSDPKHPAQKPVSILKKMIQMASNPNDIIFDPFMGVGSTGVAALEMGRKFIGVELEKNYYQAARIRIDNMKTQENSFARASYSIWNRTHIVRY